MAEYVRRGGLDISPPPWECPRIEAAVFYVRADPKRLQAICDRTLNAPSNGRLRYTSHFSWVALTFQKFRQLRSTSGHSWHGESHEYNEAAFWMLVEGGHGPELLIPYMFVDDWVALAAGREIYGYPKEYAEVELPARDAPRDFAVRGLAARNQGSVARQPILSCKAGPDGGVWLQPQSTHRDFRATIEPAGVLYDLALLIELMLSGQLPSVFLRQFRALGGGSGADLQQVVSAVADPFAFGLPADGSPWILHDYELRVGAHHSHPFVDDFGFALEPDGSIAVPLGFQCDIQMHLLPGTTR